MRTMQFLYCQSIWQCTRIPNLQSVTKQLFLHWKCLYSKWSDCKSDREVQYKKRTDEDWVHRSVISFGCYTDICFVEIRNSAAELSIECENLKIKGGCFLMYVKKTVFWRDVCVHNT